jgi:hypothetical protein
MPRLSLDDLPERYRAQVLNQIAGGGPAPQLERASRHGALGSRKGEKADTGKFLVRVTSFRRRLLDEDNLAEKYHVDCCRYAGLLPSDAPQKAKIEVAQQKVGMKEDEYTLVEITPI